jgi:sec-independent protein translocase protein TatA
MRLGTSEMLLILAVALLMFGANKLPQLGDALGKSIRNFKRAADGDGVLAALSEEPAKLAPAHAQSRELEGAKKA